jgi:hypothetical protein
LVVDATKKPVFSVTGRRGLSCRAPMASVCSTRSPLTTATAAPTSCIRSNADPTERSKDTQSVGPLGAEGAAAAGEAHRAPVPATAPAAAMP